MASNGKRRMGRGRPLSGRLKSFTGVGAALPGYFIAASAADVDRTQILTSAENSS
jgi:hypothetical protein